MHDFIVNHPLISGAICLLFISFPQWANSVWGLVSKEPLIPLILNKMKAMKIPTFSIYWVTTAIGILMLLYICITVSHFSKPDGQQASPTSSLMWIPDPDTNLESAYESHMTDNEWLTENAVTEFKAHDYTYAAMFMRRANLNSKNTPDSYWPHAYAPWNAAAELAVNPTAEGYSTFSASMDDLVNRIHIQSTNGTGKIFGQPIPDYLPAVEADLNEIKSSLPKSEWHMIDDHLKVLQTITAPSSVNPSK